MTTKIHLGSLKNRISLLTINKLI